MNRPTGVILTGGLSSRMGSDKAFVVAGDRPMAVIVADALWEGGCNPVECQGGDLDRLRAELGLTAEPDVRAGGGPVVAIASALERVERHVLVAACDLPGLDATTVRAVVDAGRTERSVAVASADGRDHLVADWPSEAASTLTELIESGSGRMPSFRDALDACDARRVPVASAAVRNVNRPDDIDPERS